ncbi:MAG: ABC transporter ATP-binding protein [Candidatus Saccharibacteria bacterium]
MPIIETFGLTKYYGRNRGIEEISLAVQEGEFFGFIGPNGAGKSTTIRTLLNFVFPSWGAAYILGMNCVTKSTEIKQKVGYVPSEINYYRSVKVRDLLRYAASFHKNVDKAYIKRLCDEFEVEVDKRIGQLSLGNRKKVAVVQALIHQPRLLILDEPASGLDPLMQNRLFVLLSDINRQGTTVFLSSHNLTEVQRFCHRVAIIRDGAIIEVSEVAALLGPTVRHVTLKTRDDLASILQALGVNDIQLVNDECEFTFEGSPDRLIKTLAQFSIEDLRIEEQSLESKFLHYYEQGGRAS